MLTPSQQHSLEEERAELKQEKERSGVIQKTLEEKKRDHATVLQGIISYFLECIYLLSCIHIRKLQIGGATAKTGA